MNRKKQKRQGATVVEFALVAPLFFLTVFGCIDFARFWMAESIVENAVFQSARHVSVFGGNQTEAEEFATRELAVVGISDFTLRLTAFENGTPQPNGIDDDTTNIKVEIEVPSEGVSIFSRFLSGQPLIRSTTTSTNRPE